MTVRIYEDLRLVQSRLAMLQAAVVLLVAALVVQFWNLQVVRARHFREQAENNRSRVVTLAAPRGALVDRKGQLLVGNRPSFNVVLMPEHAREPRPAWWRGFRPRSAWARRRSASGWRGASRTGRWW